MGTLLSGLLSGASSIFGGVWGYVGIGVVALGVGMYGGYRLEYGALEANIASQAQAQVKAVQVSAAIQKREDATVTAAAVAEATAQQKIVTQTVTVKQEVTKYVPVIKSCVPVGLVRVFDASAGVDPSASGIAASQPNDACTTISWDQVASELADDYGTGQQNAEQLNALIASVKAINAAQTASPSTAQ